MLKRPRENLQSFKIIIILKNGVMLTLWMSDKTPIQLSFVPTPEKLRIKNLISSFDKWNSFCDSKNISKNRDYKLRK